MRSRAGLTEWPLVVFTVLSQTAAGLCVLHLGVVAWAPEAALAPGRVPAWALGLTVLGAVVAGAHLGRRSAARFALGNLDSSWLSREVLLVGAFGFVTLAAATFGRIGMNVRPLEYAAAGVGLLLVDAIARVYRLRTVPAWDTWATPFAFFGTSLILGAAGLAWLLVATGETAADPALRVLGILVSILVIAQVLVFLLRARSSPRTHTAVRRCVYAVLGSAILVAYTVPGHGSHHATAIGIACVLLLASEVLGRFLFYASHRRVGL